MLCILGCSGDTTSPTAPAQSAPQTYFAPGPQTYVIDDSMNKFSQNTFAVSPPKQVGSQVLNAGDINVVQRGLLSLGISASYAVNTQTNQYEATTYSPDKPGGFAVELAGQAGALVQLVGQIVSPAVPAVQCPDLKSSQTYQFLTIPAGLTNLDTLNPNRQAATWNPVTDTAYGSVDISTAGSSVLFNTIHQFTLPSAGGIGTPTAPAASSVTGACGSTFFGNTVTLPYPPSVTNPGGVGQATPVVATIGIGPTGMLVEDNGTQNAGNSLPKYNTALGGGVGAIGIPKSSSALDTGALLGAQYLGFIYGAGVSGLAATTGQSSHLASFGFPSVPSTCSTVAPGTSSLIYGGDFKNEDPSTSSNGFGNCDLAIDLGAQDPSNNGLYPHATVWLGATYAANARNKTYSFPAVAIAGQFKGKYALFLLGAEPAQPWAVYLLQSN